MPSLFERANSRRNIFLSGSREIGVNRYTDRTVSTDRQIEILINKPDLEISTLNWTTNLEIELKYKLPVDTTQVHESPFRTLLIDQRPWLRWTAVSHELLAVLNSGTSMTVSLVSKGVQVVHEDSYKLARFSEILTAVHKLLADSSRISYAKQLPIQAGLTQ